jgi:hypothetical protein
MRFRLVRTITVAMALSVAMPETIAFAQEPTAQDIAQARQLGQQATAAYEAGNYAEAEKLYAAASKLYPLAPTLTLGLARSQAKQGKVVSAQENYNKIVREWGANATAPQPFKDAAEAAKNEVGAVSARVASLLITVEGAQNPTVTIDGVNVPSAALGLKRPVDPGTHLVKASADGMKPAETSVHVAEGASAEAKLKLEKDPNAPSVTPVPVTNPPPGTPPGTEPPGEQVKAGNKTLAFVAFGVGGAGLLVGSITGLVAMGKHSDLEGRCPNGKCPADAQGDVDGYKSMGTISTIGFIVAGVGAAAGVILLVTSPKQQTGTRTTTPTIGLGGAGIAGTF